MKRLNELGLKNVGVLEKINGSLEGLFFDHEMRWERRGWRRKLVEHMLAVQVSECQMDDTDILAEPRAGRGATLAEAATQLEEHLLEWFGQRERRIVVGQRFYKIVLSTTGLSVIEVEDYVPSQQCREPYGGPCRAVLESEEPYTDGIGQMLDGLRQ